MSSAVFLLNHESNITILQQQIFEGKMGVDLTMYNKKKKKSKLMCLSLTFQFCTSSIRCCRQPLKRAKNGHSANFIRSQNRLAAILVQGYAKLSSMHTNAVHVSCKREL